MSLGLHMTRAEIPTIQIFNRPFKPLAVGLILATGTVGLNAVYQLFFNTSIVTTPSSISPLLGLLALLSVGFMIYAWVSRMQRLYEIGLVFAVGAWAFQGVGLLIDGGFGFMFPLSMMTMAAGAFLLERADERVGMG